MLSKNVKLNLKSAEEMNYYNRKNAEK